MRFALVEGIAGGVMLPLMKVLPEAGAWTEGGSAAPLATRLCCCVGPVVYLVTIHQFCCLASVHVASLLSGYLSFPMSLLPSLLLLLQLAVLQSMLQLAYMYVHVSFCVCTCL